MSTFPVCAHRAQFCQRHIGRTEYRRFAGACFAIFQDQNRAQRVPAINSK